METLITLICAAVAVYVLVTSELINWGSKKLAKIVQKQTPLRKLSGKESYILTHFLLSPAFKAVDLRQQGVSYRLQDWLSFSSLIPAFNPHVYLLTGDYDCFEISGMVHLRDIHEQHHLINGIKTIFPYDAFQYLHERSNELQVVFIKNYAIVVNINGVNVLERQESEIPAEYYSSIISERALTKQEKQSHDTYRFRALSAGLLIIALIALYIGIDETPYRSKSLSEYNHTLITFLVIAYFFAGLALVTALRKKSQLTEKVLQVRGTLRAIDPDKTMICIGDFMLKYPKNWEAYLLTRQGAQLDVDLVNNTLLRCDQQYSIEQEVRLSRPWHYHRHILLAIVGCIGIYFAMSGIKEWQKDVEFTFNYFTQPMVNISDPQQIQQIEPGTAITITGKGQCNLDIFGTLDIECNKIYWGASDITVPAKQPLPTKFESYLGYFPIKTTYHATTEQGEQIYQQHNQQRNYYDEAKIITNIPTIMADIKEACQLYDIESACWKINYALVDLIGKNLVPNQYRISYSSNLEKLFADDAGQRYLGELIVTYRVKTDFEKRLKDFFDVVISYPNKQLFTQVSQQQQGILLDIESPNIWRKSYFFSDQQLDKKIFPDGVLKSVDFKVSGTLTGFQSKGDSTIIKLADPQPKFFWQLMLSLSMLVITVCVAVSQTLLLLWGILASAKRKKVLADYYQPYEVNTANLMNSKE